MTFSFSLSLSLGRPPSLREYFEGFVVLALTNCSHIVPKLHPQWPAHVKSCFQLASDALESLFRANWSRHLESAEHIRGVGNRFERHQVWDTSETVLILSHLRRFTFPERSYFKALLEKMTCRPIVCPS